VDPARGVRAHQTMPSGHELPPIAQRLEGKESTDTKVPRGQSLAAYQIRSRCGKAQEGL